MLKAFVLFLIFILQSTASQAVQCLRSLPTADIKNLSCEAVQTSKKCEDFYQNFQSAQVKEKLKLICPPSEAQARAVAGSCSGLMIMAGLGVSKKVVPAAAGWVAQRVPAYMTHAGSKVAPFLGVVGFAAGVTMTVYSVTDFLLETLTASDRACFEDVERKKAVLEFQYMASQSVFKAIADAKPAITLADHERRSLTVPPEYLKEQFIRDVTCEQLKEITLTQQRKQNQILGPLIASGKLKKDPRKEMALSEADRDFIGYLHENMDCINPAIKTEVICAIGSAAFGGHQLRSVLGMDSLKRPSRSPVSPEMARAKAAASVAPAIQGEKEILEKATKNFPGYKMDKPKLSSQFKTTSYYDLEVKDAQGRQIGRFSYEIDSQDKSIKVASTFIEDEADRGKGVSNLLMLTALKEHPEIQVIKAQTLQDDNLNKAWEVLSKTKDCVAAFKNTPAYKSRARLGFSEIFDADCSNLSDLSFKSRRP